MARIAAAAIAMATLATAGVAGRAAVTASFAVLGHLHWLWIPGAVLLESASIAAFAIMLRRLLAAGGASVGVRPMLATAYAANAVSVSVPLAGPALATAFTFRRFTRQGADAPLAGWSLLAGGVISSAAAALIVVGDRGVPGSRRRTSRPGRDTQPHLRRDGVALRQPSFWPIRWRPLVLQTRTAVADDTSPAGANGRRR